MTQNQDVADTVDNQAIPSVSAQQDISQDMSLFLEKSLSDVNDTINKQSDILDKQIKNIAEQSSTVQTIFDKQNEILDMQLNESKVEKQNEQNLLTLQEDNHKDLLNSFENLENTIVSASDDAELLSKLDLISTKLDVVTDLGISVNDVAMSVGVYSFILIPIVVVCWLVYRAVFMWVKPFI